MERYRCWFAHRESYVSHETIIERVVKSTFSFRIVRKVIDDNNNPYMNMVIDVMRMIKVIQVNVQL